MKKSIKATLLLTILALAVFAFPLISATSTLVSPVVNGNYSGTMLVSCTAAETNATLANISYDIGSGSVLLVSIANTSVNQTSFNQTVSISGLTQSLSYNFFCNVSNMTTNYVDNSTIATGITIDNTAPTCSISFPYSTVAVPGTEPLTWASADSLSLVNTTVTVTGPAGFSTYTSTNAAGSSIDLGSLTNTGTYTTTIVNYDRPLNTCTQTGTWTVYTPGYASSGAAGAPSSASPGFSIGGGSSAPVSATGFIVIAVIVGLVIYFATKKH